MARVKYSNDIQTWVTSEDYNGYISDLKITRSIPASLIIGTIMVGVFDQMSVRYHLLLMSQVTEEYTAVATN